MVAGNISTAVVMALPLWDQSFYGQPEFFALLVPDIRSFIYSFIR